MPNVASRLWLLLLVGCVAPVAPGEVVHLDLNQWWPEAEYRLNYWLDQHPECHRMYLNPTNWVTVRVAVLTTEKPCFYRASRRTIVYDERWLDGCMAHELGHAALDMAGNRCYHDFEH